MLAAMPPDNDLVTVTFDFTSTEGDLSGGIQREREVARKNLDALLERLKLTYLIKVVSRREYAELAQNGTLRFGSVSSFRKMEDKERGDPDEGALIRGPGQNFRFFVGPDRTELTDVVDFAVHSKDAQETIFLYCTYSVDWLKVFRCSVYMVPAVMKDFGAYAIGFNAYDFVALAVKSCREKGVRFDFDFVDYVKDDYHGHWGPFRKRLKYAHQQEFRFAIRAEPTSLDPAKKDEHFFTMDAFPRASILEMKHGFLRLFHPCKCHSNFTGILAPARRRPKRIKRKIAKRYGALHHYQRCIGCGEEFRVVGEGEDRAVRKRRRHRSRSGARQVRTGKDARASRR